MMMGVVMQQAVQCIQGLSFAGGRVRDLDRALPFTHSSVTDMYVPVTLAVVLSKGVQSCVVQVVSPVHNTADQGMRSNKSVQASSPGRWGMRMQSTIT